MKTKKTPGSVQGTFPIFARSLLKNEHECFSSWPYPTGKNRTYNLERKRVIIA